MIKGLTLNIRTSTSSDVVALGALYVELQGHHFALQPHNPRYQVDSERWHQVARAALEDPDGDVLVADEDGVVVGCAVLRYEEKPWGLACQIETLIVSAGWRGRGIGGELMTASEEVAANRGALGMRVEVVVENDNGRSFYERRGYRPLALRYGKGLDEAGAP